MAKKGLLKKIDAFAPMNQPVGRAVIWTVGFGLTRGLSGVAAKFLPLETQLGARGTEMEMGIAHMLIAFVAKLRPIENFIGRDLAGMLAIASWIGAVQKFLPLDQMLESWINPVAASPAASAASTPSLSLLNPFNWPSLIAGGIAKTMQSAGVTPATGTEGVGDIDTLLPVEGSYGVLSGMGAAPLLLTRAERKLASIVG